MPDVELRRIDKSFGAVAALHDVSVSIRDGEAHAIVGENGAGKSTLLKILAGSLRPDRGELNVGGRKVALTSARDALAHGIGLVHQETLAFPNLSVAANIFAGRELTGRWGWLRVRDMRERARVLLDYLHLPIAPDDPVEKLPVAYRQLLQVARALAFDCRTLALDEPTTSLTAAEAAHLFGILDALKRSGVTIIYVSHRLPEVFRLCDRVTTLRDGRVVSTVGRNDVTPDDIVQAMVGRSIPDAADARRAVRAGLENAAAFPADREPPLRLERLSRPPWFEEITLAVPPGEIAGVFGLVGSGRTELLETIVGLRRPEHGILAVAGRVGMFRSAREAARAGVVLVPEDRQRQGLFFNLSLRHNLVLPVATIGRDRMVRDAERDVAASLLQRWRIMAPSIEATPSALSGGNQQKVVVAKWLAVDPRVLLLDEPTKGVDVAAKYEIHGFVREMAARGAACLMVSSDLPEVLSLANRVLVMREGRIRGEVMAGAEDFNEECVMRLAAGGAEA